MLVRDALDHIISTITGASLAQAAAVRMRLQREGLGDGNETLVEVAARLAGARHSPRPSLENRVAAVIAADHGFASPGIDLGENSPSAVALRLMAEGGAAINSATRSAETSLVLVDAGIWGNVENLGTGVLSFRTGNGTADLRNQPAMSEADAIAALQTGIAVAFSLADTGLDIMALGHLGVGGEVSATAIACAVLGQAPEELCGKEDLPVLEAAFARASLDSSMPLELLAEIGGFELGVMTGMILACASVHVPIVVDGVATAAAALLAAQFNDGIRGYLFASHCGGRAHAAILEALELKPLFAVGLSHGEGTGSVLAMPMLAAASRVIREVA